MGRTTKKHARTQQQQVAREGHGAALSSINTAHKAASNGANKTCFQKHRITDGGVPTRAAFFPALIRPPPTWYSHIDVWYLIITMFPFVSPSTYSPW